ncbi:BCAM0308 family protein [Geoalkalibacter sp.]|uniref:BCAM0308 family protein n=1 Tax=Geoalkalibacter sp. TaxID=3041440 RepID=UPI00272E016B|nr:BCAM0308 family protein [Geoalkalibacter sp.]
MQKDVRKFGISDKRGRTKTSEDPYVPEAGLREPAICESCNALYRNRRWQMDAEGAAAESANPQVQRVTCPACQKIAERYAEGVVTLRGRYLWEHEEEIRNILRNEENRAMAKNPLQRIMRMEREGDELIIETTEEKLAEHLGRALHSAHQGELSVTWSKEHSLCRVNWERLQ